MNRRRWLTGGALAFALLLVIPVISCGAVTGSNLCDCVAVAPDIADYRHNAKHVPLPSVTPQEITVATILSWPQTPVLPPDLPRFGRELQLVHVANAWLQNASVNPTDCDVHLEIAASPARNAPRVIVETPVDSEYCSARQQIQSALKQHGFQLDETHGGDLPQPLPAQVLGLPFEDFEHDRGGTNIATLWEIHPAIVTLK